MSGIFISYRRSDSAGHTGRLFDRLRARFGERRVFIDVCDIDAGSDFARTIERRIGACDVLLAIIGQEWLDSRNAAGGRRLDEAGDFVRLEIAAALRRGLVVIPVLVEQARVPTASELPAAVRELAGRNAFSLRDERWDGDVEHLIQQIRKQIPFWRRLGWRLGRLTPRIARLAYVAALGALLIIGGRLAWERWWPASITEVPDIARLDIDAARSLLDNAGLRLGAQAHEFRHGYPAGVVIRQEPAAGLVVRKGRAVSVVLARAAGKVPALAGKSREAAAELLAQQGLALGRVLERESSQATPGSVVEQSVDPETMPVAPEQLTVDIVVAKAPPLSPPIVAAPTPIPVPAPAGDAPGRADVSIRVPPLTGLTLAAAKAVLAESGLTLGAVRKQRTTDGAPDSVLSQSPRTGVAVDRGARIDLTVAQRTEAPVLVTVRNVVGMEIESAKAALARQGLAVRSAVGAARADVAPGRVASQTPAPGAAVSRGSTVALVYAPAGVVAVPELVGLTLEVAERKALAAGMTIGARTFREVDDGADGVVIAQFPMPGAGSHPPGTPVALTVARRTADVTPPAARGTLVLRLGSAADIDAGMVTASTADDLAYKSAGGVGPYVSGTNLEPVNGAAYAVVNAADAARCLQASYSTQARNATNLLNKRLCVRTNEGRYVAVTVERMVGGAGEKLEISFTRL
jgi:beta-lactam-binding protein with PASTA domain